MWQVGEAGGGGPALDPMLAGGQPCLMWQVVAALGGRWGRALGLFPLGLVSLVYPALP